MDWTMLTVRLFLVLTVFYARAEGQPGKCYVLL